MEIKDVNDTKINKTWRFLVPSLKDYGRDFVIHFVQVYKYAAGIYDCNKEGELNAEDRNIYLLCDSFYKKTLFNSFLEFVKDKDYFVTSYVTEFDHIETELPYKTMVVIKIPEKFSKAFDMFLESRFSEMYSSESLPDLFFDVTSIIDRKILMKSKDSEKVFVEEVNVRFKTELSLEDFEGNINEHTLPIDFKDEVFNFTS